jgi:fermentation-respiration switch protein FrsA (DUF1100 family)
VSCWEKIQIPPDYLLMLFKLGVMAAIGYAVLAAVLFLFQSRFVYYPDVGRNIIGTPKDHGLDYESVRIDTEDGEKLHGWFVPSKDATATVLFFHGNAGNISTRLGYLLMFYRLGYNTFIIDYRGYGESSGTPSEQGTYRDAQAAWRYLTEQRNIPSNRIVLLGESLGGAVATWLAVREKPALLVLASAFTSVADMAEAIYPFLPTHLLTRFDYNTGEYLRGVTCPVFVAHSPQDEIVPFEQGEALYASASEPKQFLELQGGHNNGFIYMREEWVRALGDFMRRYL